MWLQDDNRGNINEADYKITSVASGTIALSLTLYRTFFLILQFPHSVQ